MPTPVPEETEHISAYGFRTIPIMICAQLSLLKYSLAQQVFLQQDGVSEDNGAALSDVSSGDNQG